MIAHQRGTVVSIIPSWHPTDRGGRSRRLLLLVEYDTGRGPAVARSVTMDRPGLTVGSEVSVLIRPGGRVTVIFDDPSPVPRWWSDGQPVSGLLAYAGLVLVMLMLAAGIWLAVTSRSEEILPSAPPGGWPTGSASATTSPAG